MIVGLVAALLLLASSLAHSMLGWPQLTAELAKAGAPPDLVTGLKIGWHFAGAAMFAFGVIAAWHFADALRRRPISLRPIVIIALVYLAFGTWALLASGLDPFFFFVFIAPGLLLLGASWGMERTAAPHADRERAARG
jgi:hypothetical protein